MMMIGEMGIAQREAVIVPATEAVMEGDHPVLIVEKEVVLIMVVEVVHIRGKGVAPIMGMAAAVVEALIGEREVVLLMGVEALVHIEESGMILNVKPTAVRITRSERGLTSLPPVVREK